MGGRKHRPALVGMFVVALFSVLPVHIRPNSTSTVVHAQAGSQTAACSNASFSGRYAVLATGSILTGSDGTPLTTPLPFAEIEIANVDGAGNVSLSGALLNLAGMVSQDTASGTYAVNPDCTFTTTRNTQNGPAHAMGVLEAGGKKVDLISADPSAIINGSGVQLASSCSNASLSGSYGYMVSGTVLAGPDGTPLPGSIPLTEVGTATPDGAGNITLAGTTNIGGVVVQDTWIGTYRVNADCTGVETDVSDTGQTVHSALVVTASGRVILIGTDPDSVVSVTASQRPASCSNTMLNGRYAVLSDVKGLVGPDGAPLANSVRGAALDIVTADGAGGFSASRTANVGGGPNLYPVNGSYAVNADCTFTVAGNTPNGIGHAVGVLMDGGRASYLIGTDPTGVTSGSGYQMPDSCSIANLDGAYGYALGGYVLVGPDGTPLASPIAMSEVGVAHPDGAGNITGAGVNNTGGMVSADNFSGKDILNTDCTGTETGVSADGLSFHSATALTSRGAFILLGTDPGAVISITAAPQ